MVPVKKSDGTYRICIDYRELNKLLRKNVGSLGDIVGMYDRMKGSKYFVPTSLLQESETMDRYNEALEKMKPVDLNKVSNDDKLKLYGLFKQINVGDCNTKRPGMLDPKGKAKWDAWKGVEGKSKDDAMNGYAEAVDSILASLA